MTDFQDKLQELFPIHYRSGNILLLNADCMKVMEHIPDKHCQLACVDPPYGIARFGNRIELSNRICKEAKINKWDIKPDKEYFEEFHRQKLQ